MERTPFGVIKHSCTRITRGTRSRVFLSSAMCLAFCLALFAPSAYGQSSPTPADSCTGQFPGDVNGDGYLDVSDIAYLLDFLCQAGTEPILISNGDVNGDCVIDSLDVTYIGRFLFQGGPPPVICTCVNPVIGNCAVDTCAGQIPGDANGDGNIDVADISYLGDFLCAGGPPPVPLSNGDPNGDCIIDTSDVLYISRFLFGGGPAPAGCACLNPEIHPCVADSCNGQFPGDANSDGQLDVSDMSYLLEFLCLGGSPPNPLANGDPNGDCVIDSSDVTYLGRYLFNEGVAPVLCTCVNPSIGSCAVDTCAGQSPGDANGDGNLDGADISFLSNYLCQEGPPPVPLSNGDPNGDCSINLDDVRYVAEFLFLGGPAPVDCTCLNPVTEPCVADTCAGQRPGDANSDGRFDVSDISYLLNFLCLGGPPPAPLSNGDPNGDCMIDSLDVDYISKWLFSGGTPPVGCTCVNPDIGLCAADTCAGQFPGDANGDGNIDVSDMSYLGNFICIGGPPPMPLANGDPNGDCVIDTIDIAYIGRFLFAGGPPPVNCTCPNPIIGSCVADSCVGQFPGDANGDGNIDISDMSYLGNFLCLGGPPPMPLANGDPNGDCLIDSSDIQFISDFLFAGGPGPVFCTCTNPEIGLCIVDPCTGQMPGDANSDGGFDLSDMSYIANFICLGGPAPNPLANGDPNGDCLIDLEDVEYLGRFLFSGGPPPVPCTCNNPVIGSCVPDSCVGQLPGDANGDNALDISDMTYLLEFLCLGGPAPIPLANGDPNGDCIIDTTDVNYLAAYLFSNGPLPVDCTCLNPEIGLCIPDTCAGQRPGDANSDGGLDLSDMSYIANFICLGGPAPNPLANGDPNGDCVIDLDDVEYLGRYLFSNGPPPVSCTCVDPAIGQCVPDSCLEQMPGDANGNSTLDISDMSYLLEFLCLGGPAPIPLANGDPNGDCTIDTTDVSYLGAYLFGNGPPPVDCTCLSPDIGLCVPDSCAAQMPGDANGDNIINVADISYLKDFLCDGGPPPNPLSNGDPNGDCSVDTADITYIGEYLFGGGPKAVRCTCEDPIIGTCLPDSCLDQMPGDLNNDGQINVTDLVFLTDYVCGSGPAPSPLANGDPSGDCIINTKDVLYLAHFLNNFGPPPVTCTCLDPRFGWIRGDVNKDCDINAEDIIYLVNYVFKSGRTPIPEEEVGNVNCIGAVTAADIITLVKVVFESDTLPQEICPDP